MIWSEESRQVNRIQPHTVDETVSKPSTRNASAVVCHIGAREHYSVSRTFHSAGVLSQLITDVWVRPQDIALKWLPKEAERLRGRFHADLYGANVAHFTRQALLRRLRNAVRFGQSKWDSIISTNRWFQHKAALQLASTLRASSNKRVVVYAYSYAALEVLRVARSLGATPVLVQIDGGEADEALIGDIARANGFDAHEFAPKVYWEQWHAECEAAENIVVQSEWSRSLLVSSGIDGRKIQVVAAIGDQPIRSRVSRVESEHFSMPNRPMRVLFLGALTFRKGVQESLAAAKLLEGLPVEFVFVGGDYEHRRTSLLQRPNVRHIGLVPRSRVAEFYSTAHVFLFPTHSDGFGMTQLEALCAGLPVIASSNCARLVEHGRTGLLLDSVSAQSIVAAVTHLLDRPELLAQMSAAAPLAAAAHVENGRTALLRSLESFASTADSKDRLL